MPAWSGFWDNNPQSPQAHSLIGKYPNRNRIRRLVNREGFRRYTELFDTLIGAGAGGTAAATHKRIAAQDSTAIGALGGVRTVETVTDINRASTNADITALKEMVFNVKTRPSYPADLSGNGGPAFS